VLTKVIESYQVTLGQIKHMDIISDGSTVLGFVI
jgi:hypothetical protein